MLWNNVCPTKLNKFLIWAKRRSFWTFKFHLKKAAKWKLEMTDKDICSRKHKRLFSLLIKTFWTLGRQSVWTVPVFFCSYNDPALEFPVDLPIKLAVGLTERHWGATSNSFPPEKKEQSKWLQYLDCGCSTLVEYSPTELKSMGSNPSDAGLWHSLYPLGIESSIGSSLRYNNTDFLK